MTASPTGKPGNSTPTHKGQFDFTPHGQASARVQGHVLRISARGPFNAEGVHRLRDAMLLAYSELPPGTRVVNISEMLETLVFPQDAWDGLRTAIRATSASGHVILATAWVVAADVEGRRLMLPKARAFFAECGRRFEVFETHEAAEAWAQEVLNESQASSGQQP